MKSSNKATGITPEIPVHDLRSQLNAHNDYVLGLVDTIPPKWYFDQDTVQKLTEELHERVDAKVNSSKKFQKLAVHGKSKLARLDPSTFKTVSQILNDQALTQTPKNRKKRRQRKNSKPTLYSAALDRASNLDELKERLTEKIEALKGNRKVPGISRQEKKAKELEKSKAAKKRKRNKASKGSLDAAAADANGEQEAGAPEKKVPKTIPVYNKEGKMVFSKFDLAETDVSTHERKPAAKVAKQPKRLLKKLDVEAEKLKKLEEKNPEQAKEVKQKKLWLKAIDKAEGIKVKDNPELLKKTMKRKDKQKKQSRKKWKARTETVEKRQKDRQEKRQKNIKDRKKSKLQGKLKKLKKRGRVIPGF
ncbi:surfeit locus protein 6 homolog isoform X2 [Ornithodoros turicata]|uniref:surfeit locus protein 6 homolog isoform X2 n=1 Tax=Ornithodoros turicata TaxID=34597 RepID=UPI00313986F3